MGLFNLNFDVVFTITVSLIIPLCLVFFFKRSYVIGIALIALGLLLIGLHVLIGSTFNYLQLRECEINELLYLTLDWWCGRRVVVGYGFIFGGIILVLFQFISETFLHGNKQ